MSGTQAIRHDLSERGQLGQSIAVERFVPLQWTEAQKPGRDLTLLAQKWLQEGLPPELPCALVSRASQPGQQVRYSTLAALGDAESPLTPSLLIAGWTVREAASALHSAADGIPVLA